MEHSPEFDKVKNYYDNYYWPIERVREAVVKGWITQAEFTEITGQPY